MNPFPCVTVFFGFSLSRRAEVTPVAQTAAQPHGTQRSGQVPLRCTRFPTSWKLPRRRDLKGQYLDRLS